MHATLINLGFAEKTYDADFFKRTGNDTDAGLSPTDDDKLNNDENIQASTLSDVACWLEAPGANEEFAPPTFQLSHYPQKVLTSKKEGPRQCSL